jgi:hypothetical protein
MLAVTGDVAAREQHGAIGPAASRARCRIAEPHLGWRDIRLEGAALKNIQPLSIVLDRQPPSVARPPQEAYVRGADLIATYAECPEPEMRTQIYWRTAAPSQPGVLAAIELLVSVQTSILDSCPRLETRSTLLADEILRLADPVAGPFVTLAPPPISGEPSEPCGGPRCYLFRLASSAYSYAEMIYPAVAELSEMESVARDLAFQATLRHQLFAARLEKGVVLRARILSLLCDRDGDAQTAALHYRAFLAGQLPLTT